MSDIVEETFAQENIPDVEGSIAAFFLGWCGKRASEDSVDEGCEPFVQDCKLFGQDYDQLKVPNVMNHSLQIDPELLPSPACSPQGSCSLTQCSLSPIQSSRWTG